MEASGAHFISAQSLSPRVKLLTRETLLADPFAQFTAWFEEAKACPGIRLPEAMCLSTVDPGGLPDGRMLLLKQYDRRGFVFYTGLQSTKGRALLAFPRAALTFYWEELDRQVRIQGTTELVAEDEADAYFATRPRPSQIAAHASEQSAPLADRAALERRVEELRAAFEGKPVPRPRHWGGLRVVPLRCEFWQSRPDRLHDRFVFTRLGRDMWETTMLYP